MIMLISMLMVKGYGSRKPGTRDNLTDSPKLTCQIMNSFIFMFVML